MVYSWTRDPALHGYVNYSLSYFNTADFPPGMSTRPLLDPTTGQPRDIEYCRYEDYRHPPWDPQKYNFTEEYWHILTARLAFIIIFVMTVSFLTSAARVLIPDMPRSLKDQIRHENFITNELAIETELRHVKEAMVAAHGTGKSFGWVG
ncbi:hypothetical protein LAZ67_1002369 [Cordylochernes scorpioides]|uniref:Anoctamin transmembrane domain-containing protein n=1 Tax=Cordylochernes scorpioides TaxID=51811 RepID=A0ABY6JYU3_9ARAC|nr:hypothetical protein LAZ67_1002369 [Cordylochernes scorpioides]